MRGLKEKYIIKDYSMHTELSQCCDGVHKTIFCMTPYYTSTSCVHIQELGLRRWFKNIGGKGMIMTVENMTHTHLIIFSVYSVFH